jgi:hypothetical protein
MAMNTIKQKGAKNNFSKYLNHPVSNMNDGGNFLEDEHRRRPKIDRVNVNIFENSRNSSSECLYI